MTEIKELNTQDEKNLVETFEELLNNSIDPDTVKAKNFLEYVEQIRRNQYLNRLIVDLKNCPPNSRTRMQKSQNANRNTLLTNFQRHLNARFKVSKKKFAKKYTNTALKKPFKNQFELVFHDLPLLTKEDTMFRYNRLMAHFTPNSDNQKYNKIYERFQRKLSVLKEVLIIEKTRNKSEFFEEQANFHFKEESAKDADCRNYQQALVEYKTACKLVVNNVNKERKIKLRLKMAECCRLMSDKEES